MEITYEEAFDEIVKRLKKNSSRGSEKTYLAAWAW